MAERGISSAIIKRLPRYYRYLEDLMNEGVEHISSKEFSMRMGVTASQIRQDLSHFGGFGQQGYGYNVLKLHDEIGRIMGLEKVKRIIMIGAGNLGQALSNYANYKKRGFYIEAVFDNDPEKIGTKVQGMTVLSIDDLEDYIEKNPVDIATITIPKEAAVKVVDRIVKAGVKGIWNFAHTDLNVPPDVCVENVHLSESLMRLSYNIKNGVGSQIKGED